MLKFQTNPDVVFMAILSDSMSLMVDQLREVEEELLMPGLKRDDLQIILPNACRVFNAGTAIHTLRQMLNCHREKLLYCMNDYHFLILYDTLQNFCDIHNDFVRTADDVREKEELSMLGGIQIERINFDDLIDIYFFDIDFLLDTKTVTGLGLDGRKMLGIRDEAFGISHGLTPHSEELALIADEYERYDPAEQDQLWSESSKVYPDTKASDDSSIY